MQKITKTAICPDKDGSVVQTGHDEIVHQRRWRKLGEFKKSDSGATAIEFGILAVPFFMLFMAIIETSLLFFAGQILESSVDEVSRDIRTGQLGGDGGGLTKDKFKEAVCEKAVVLIKCDNLYLDLQVVASFDNIGSGPKPVAGALNPNQFTFKAPGRAEIAVVTAMYEWPVFTNYMEKYLSDLDNGNALLTAKTAFMTEP